MDTENSSRDMIMNAVHLVAMMSISDLAKTRNISTTKMFMLFMESKTAEVLYDTESKLWCDGPAAVEAEYLKEIGKAS